MRYAMPGLKIKMSLLDRKFYRGRLMSEDAVKCLVNDSLRHDLNKRGGWRAAQPNRTIKKRGRPVL